MCWERSDGIQPKNRPFSLFLSDWIARTALCGKNTKMIRNMVNTPSIWKINCFVSKERKTYAGEKPNKLTFSMTCAAKFCIQASPRKSQIATSFSHFAYAIWAKNGITVQWILQYCYIRNNYRKHNFFTSEANCVLQFPF